MLPPRRLVIAASEPRFSQAVQTHLLKSLQVLPPVVRFEDVPQLLAPETDGDILLLAAVPDDIPLIENVIREAKVQLSPASFAILESDAVAVQRPFEHLAPYLGGRWVWPEQARELTVWSRRSVNPGARFADPATETIAQKIRRRLVNHTPSLTAMVEQLCIASAHDVTVLIEGEAGTGKSFLARLIHECSARRASRFLAVSCGTMSGTQIAGEFFGHARGAIAGSDGVKVGKFAAVGEGTIVLDEIDALGPEHQANLLRVIESGEFEPVGSNDTMICKARIIAATNWNLAEAVERGTFRRDLFYRLHVVSFQLPPLRHRPEDIGPLVRGMVAHYGTKFGKKLFSVCPDALRTLEAFGWPGNIRQLENVVQQAVLSSSGSELKAQHLSPLIQSRPETPAANLPVSGNFGGGTLKESRAAMERSNILRALERAGQSRTRAAQLLGISRVTLYKKMGKYGLLTAKDKPVPVPSEG